MSVIVSHQFDAGNIEVVACEEEAGVARLRLAIRKDAGDEHMQWFFFRVSGARGKTLQMRIENAGQASYPAGWEGYHAVVSYDRELWHRVPTGYADGVLTLRHTPACDAAWYAYFAPYSMERHHDLVAGAMVSPRVRHELLGQTLDGQDLDLLVVDDPDLSGAADKRPLWVIARQHPGETMAEWFIEGMLERLLDEDDPVARELLRRAVLYVVPNMNPDGSRRGHLRTNAAGANLNREWQSPTMERSPEVTLVRARMQQTGVRLCLDVHGDEGLAYNFIAGPDGVEAVTPAMRALQAEYELALERANPDFQRVHGYPEAAPGKANMTMCTNWTAEAFGGLSMTLEQPFKDNANAPEEACGWSPERARKLGAANLDAIFAVVDRL